DRRAFFGCFANLAEQLLHVAESRAGERVSSIHESMDRNAWHTLAPRKLYHCQQMLVYRVNSARADESHEMKCSPVRFCLAAHGDERWILEERSIGDGSVDFHQVRHHHSSGAEVEVTDFTVAHLSFWKTNACDGRLEESARWVRPD